MVSLVAPYPGPADRIGGSSRCLSFAIVKLIWFAPGPGLDTAARAGLAFYFGGPCLLGDRDCRPDVAGNVGLAGWLVSGSAEAVLVRSGVAVDRDLRGKGVAAARLHSVAAVVMSRRKPVQAIRAIPRTWFPVMRTRSSGRVSGSSTVPADIATGLVELTPASYQE